MKFTISIRKLIAGALALSSLCVPLAAISQDDARALLRKAQDTTSFYETDFKADYEVLQDKPGEGTRTTNATIYRRDKASKWTILIKAPLKDKGKGYLQTDNSVWFYDPADKRFTFTSSKDKFQGTNANTSDFAPQLYADNYDIKSADEVRLGSFDCVLFTLSAKKAKSVDYPEIKIWVSKNDGLTRMKEDYSLSGQKLRTTLIPTYQKITGSGGKVYWIPVSMQIVDNLKGQKIGGKMVYERTLISISNAQLAKQDDVIYTKPYLELMAGN